jgi:hypothetical protein
MSRSAVRRWNVITDRPTTSGLVAIEQGLDGRQDAVLDEDQVGDSDGVVRIDIPRQGRERAVRHADGDRRHVLERVGHRQQQDLHRGLSRGKRCGGVYQAATRRAASPDADFAVFAPPG